MAVDLFRRRRPKAQTAAQRSQARFTRRQWARRWLTWKPILAAVLVLALIAGGVWLVFFSTVLSVQEAEVSGDDYLSKSEVIDAAEVPMGDPMATADLDGVKQRVEALAAVKSVDVVRSWPHTVTIDITERTPVAVVDLGGDIRGLDSDGVLFRDYDKAPSELPRVQSGEDAGTDALAEAATVVSSLPSDLSADVAHVEVDSVDRIGLALDGGASVVWGSAEESASKAEVLAALIAKFPDAESYNVSVPGHPSYIPAGQKVPEQPDS